MIDIQKLTETKFEILIVDDIPENLQVLGSILNIYGFEVSFASDGKQALYVIEYAKPDLILLDVSMPEMDGFEVCQKLKSNQQTSDIPVIFLTALSDTEHIVKGFELGGVDYITKPFNSAELIARVKTHLLIKEQRKQIFQLVDDLTQLNLELEQRNFVIEQKNKNIHDSIEYAKVIQNSFLPAKNKLSELFENGFIFYKPKDVISGDFYYYEQVGDKIIVIVADCTGHGVPGALLSVLGTSILNELVINQQITDPSILLEKLDTEFMQMLTKSHKDLKMNDGMDMIITVFDRVHHQLFYSTARRPLYIIRNNETIKYKANSSSVGGLYFDNKKCYVAEVVDIMNNDMIYMFTDGFSDQFGGTEYKKFGNAKLGETLQTIALLNSDEQIASLAQAFENWILNYEQIDDVLILGIKYNC